MTVNEVRQRYLDFFAKRGHTVIPSAPIVPENDSTTLFTSSGMQPLVPYLLGQPHPEGTRLVDSQLSFRAQDIEEVGDNRHTTFFEMLGNWSLGDYFKKEQLPWLFEFLTKELGLSQERLWVTCFEGDAVFNLPKDEESARIWKELGIPDERIRFYNAKQNWWSRSGAPENMPAGELGGPDSEVFFDFQTPHDPAFGSECHPNCDCGRFVEIGNSVFMEYLKQPDGSFGKLPKQNVDFGGGLERLTAATLNTPDVFQIDVFSKLIAAVEEKSGKKYSDPQYTKDFRIIADHVRALTFLVAGGVLPSGQERGSIVRKLVRKSLISSWHLQLDASIESFVEIIIKEYQEIYPYLLKFNDVNLAHQESSLYMEEIGLRRADLEGKRRIEKYAQENPGRPVSSVVVSDIRTTTGVRLETIEAIAMGLNLKMPSREDIDAEFKKHQEISRAGAAQKFAGGLADHAEQTIRYHTAHHILLKALQMVLGPGVHQRGSNITSERLRIDFSYGQKMTKDQIAKVEKIVNEKIAEAIPVIRTDMKREEAEKLGAEHEFGTTYPEQVSVYSVGPLESAFSIEFCGGPHVSNTSELSEGRKTFKIQKEEASSAGVRRIKAVLE